MVTGRKCAVNLAATLILTVDGNQKSADHLGCTKPYENGIFSISTAAGFLSSTV